LDPNYLRYCVYYDGSFDDRFDPLPGLNLTTALEMSELEAEDWQRTGRKIEQSIRKMLMMWVAGDKALEAEREFYATTIQEAPALLGRHAVEVQYHCEAMIFFARSALDLSAYAFAKLLPPPLALKRTDSFNDLLKAIVASEDHPTLAELVEGWRMEEPGWLTLVANFEKGRSLRDQLAHQMGFPLDYQDISLETEKRSAVVAIGGNPPVALGELIETLRAGVVGAFITLEKVCETHHQKASTFYGEEEPNEYSPVQGKNCPAGQEG
jgi:hypothetical protein